MQFLNYCISHKIRHFNDSLRRKSWKLFPFDRVKLRDSSSGLQHRADSSTKCERCAAKCGARHESIAHVSGRLTRIYLCDVSASHVQIASKWYEWYKNIEQKSFSLQSIRTFFLCISRMLCCKTVVVVKLFFEYGRLVWVREEYNGMRCDVHVM